MLVMMYILRHFHTVINVLFLFPQSLGGVLKQCRGVPAASAVAVCNAVRAVAVWGQRVVMRGELAVCSKQ